MTTDLGSWDPDDVPEAPTAGSGFVVIEDSDALDRAEAAVERAATRLRTEQRRLAAAFRAVEDTAGAVVVVTARRNEYAAGTTSDSRDDAKSAALDEAVRKAERKALMAEEAIEDREAECRTAEAALDRARRALERKQDAAAAAAIVADEETEEHELQYGNVAEFVEDYLLPLYRRKTSVWCAQWWKHPEAEVRMKALWLAWEQLRLDPALGLSVWLRDHLDHHMPILLSNDGPLKGCKPGNHTDAREVLPSDPPQHGMYQDERVENP